MVSLGFGVGVVPQMDNLDPDFTVTENLKVYGRYFGIDQAVLAARIPALLEFAGLAGRANAGLRTLSGGKPTGFKLCIGHPWEWFAIAKAMQETGITPDFIVVDGAEGGTGAAPLEFTNHVGAPLQEGLLLVHNTLRGVGLRNRIRVGCAGKVISAFDITRMMALGADWCNSARGFMFALGCLQAQTCHTGHCPTGVTTQDPVRQRALVVPTKADRVYQYHESTLKALQELVQAAGETRTGRALVEAVDDRRVPVEGDPSTGEGPGDGRWIDREPVHATP